MLTKICCLYNINGCLLGCLYILLPALTKPLVPLKKGVHPGVCQFQPMLQIPSFFSDRKSLGTPVLACIYLESFPLVIIVLLMNHRPQRGTPPHYTMYITSFDATKIG